MRRAQQSIALVLLGIVAIIAVIGLVLLFGKPTGAYVNQQTPAAIIVPPNVNWYNLIGFMRTGDDLSTCMIQSTSVGGFAELLNGETPNCFAIEGYNVPSDVYPLYAKVSHGQKYAIACFTTFAQSQPQACVTS